MKLEALLQQQAERLGAVWFGPEGLTEVLKRARVAGTDNALLIEIDGETWTVPDAFRLDKFRPAP